MRRKKKGRKRETERERERETLTLAPLLSTVVLKGMHQSISGKIRHLLYTRHFTKSKMECHSVYFSGNFLLNGEK